MRGYHAVQIPRTCVSEHFVYRPFDRNCRLTALHSPLLVMYVYGIRGDPALSQEDIDKARDIEDLGDLFSEVDELHAAVALVHAHEHAKTRT